MATQLEYALMAGAAYRSTRNPINRIPTPENLGWTPFQYREYQSSGFEAISFQRGNEIVISFAGTGPDILDPDWLANFGLTLGVGSQQLLDAAAYYMQVRSLYPDPNTSITLTGHSLGGGLAALVGVLFNESATTFDPAPFRASANNDTRENILTYLMDLGHTDGPAITALRNFTSDLPAGNVGPSEIPGIRGEGNISRIIVQAEAITSSILLSPFSSIGISVPQYLDNGGVSNTSGIDLHSQALLIAFEQHDPFRAVTLKLPNLIKLIFDNDLYKFSTGVQNTEDVNFIDHLVRHQAGVYGSDSGTPIAPDDMLIHFTNDMQDIASAGVINQDQYQYINLNKALISFGLQAYYEQDVAFTKEAFQNIGGGIRFDRAMIPGNLTDLKGYNLYFHAYLSNRFDNDLLSIIETQLPSLQDWFIATGANPTYGVADTRPAFMLGDTKSDRFTGSNQDDLIITGEGTDILQGGQGDDTLYGGEGVDIYKYRPNDGDDVIVDNTTGSDPETGDDKGVILYDPAGQPRALAVGLRKSTDPAGQYKSLDNTITYQVSGADLTITTPTGTITVKDFNQNNKDLSIRLIDLPADPTTTLEWPALDPDPITAPNWYGLRNGTPGNDDPIYGTNDAEIIHGLTGNDYIDGLGGADRILGDEGNDILYFYGPMAPTPWAIPSPTVGVAAILSSAILPVTIILSAGPTTTRWTKPTSSSERSRGQSP